ncbi:calcium-activated chloride channel-domain-containing protein [Mycena floridula]|nr:calcium-activated chloride channel-domain-containing protein [Mycena floridula]
MSVDVDLVITFRASHKITLSKQQTREDAQKAEKQYSHLLEILSYAGLQCVGRRGESLGHLLIFIKCPEKLLQSLVRRERQSDFLSGLPTAPVKSEADVHPPSPADRLRLVHGYITSIPSDGGLGITPGTKEWDLVESVMCLHDREFNEQWIHAWTHSKVASVSETRIREQFGDSVSLYFSFLHFYSRALMLPAGLGVVFYFFGSPYSPLYSILLLLWSTVFVEWWRVRERLISLRFGTRGSFRVEKRRAQHIPGFPWWKREMRMLASIPVILLFAAILLTLLTVIFVLEAFVTQLYTGPGHRYLAFTPTIAFALLVPRFLAVYQASVQRFTAWENHSHYSSHMASLTLKTFALTALVAYLGLALSAFVYVPFGEGLMRILQATLFHGSFPAFLKVKAAFGPAFSSMDDTKNSSAMWDVDASNAGHRLNPGRLRDQMFAYTVTNQIVGTFLEIGLPYILRAVDHFRSGKLKLGSKKSGSNLNGLAKGKKKVVFEDEKEKGGIKEREFLEQVRSEAALPEYDLFVDYNEMVTQFGYVVLWSTIWPLAPVMALVNNFFELRSDAFKITVHNRRPIPARTDTIGPWLDALTFLTWLGALTNSALVYLFCPRSKNTCNDSRSPLEKVHQHLFQAAGAVRSSSEGFPENFDETGGDATRELLMTALLIAFAASHGYILVKVIVRHLVEKLVWKGSEEVIEREREEREIKTTFLKSILGDVASPTLEKPKIAFTQPDGDVLNFWDHDEGIDEIRRISKEA